MGMRRLDDANVDHTIQIELFAGKSKFDPLAARSEQASLARKRFCRKWYSKMIMVEGVST